MIYRTGPEISGGQPDHCVVFRLLPLNLAEHIQGGIGGGPQVTTLQKKLVPGSSCRVTSVVYSHPDDTLIFLWVPIPPPLSVFDGQGEWTYF